jgi:hypothetical protein
MVKLTERSLLEGKLAEMLEGLGRVESFVVFSVEL